MEIELNGSTLFYHKNGTGNKNILLFHGFGQDHKVFFPLIEILKSEYTCFSFDLFFHGNSRWANRETPIEKETWKSFMEIFLVRENISDFTVLGFSIGGRLALATFEGLPEKIEKLILVAGEGLRKNFWYSWATHSRLGQPIFKAFVRHPKIFFSFLRIAESMRLAPKPLLRFVSRQMDSYEKRQLVYSAWIGLKKLHLPEKQFLHLATKHQTKILFVFGREDHIMTKKESDRLQKQIPNAGFMFLNSSHYQLLKRLPEFLPTWLKNSDKRE